MLFRRGAFHCINRGSGDERSPLGNTTTRPHSSDLDSIWKNSIPLEISFNIETTAVPFLLGLSETAPYLFHFLFDENWRVKRGKFST